MQLSLAMQSRFTYNLLLITAVAASPIHQAPAAPRGLASSLNNLVDGVSHVIDGAGNAVRSAASQASATVESAVPELGILDSLPDPPPGTIMDEPIANEALWQEALSFDAQKNGKPNQMLYQVLAYFQKMENSSNSHTLDPLTSSSWISRGLQRLKAYPTQFNQRQANDPKTSLGESIAMVKRKVNDS